MSERHAADAEDTFIVYNVTPDLCKVGKAVVPFEIWQKLTPEKSDYAETVSARSEPVLMVDSHIKGVKGNAGKGVCLSTVSRGNGHTRINTGSGSVIVEGRQLARHMDEVTMNVKC